MTFERGQLANQLWPGEVVGAAAQGQSADFSYHAGVFSGSIDQEFTTFAGGFGAVAGLGYALPLFYENGSLHLDYLYNNGNPSNDAFEPYDHVVSLWHQGQKGPFGLGVDLTFGHGLDARPAVFGVTVCQPMCSRGTCSARETLCRRCCAINSRSATGITDCNCSSATSRKLCPMDSETAIRLFMPASTTSSSATGSS